MRGTDSLEKTLMLGKIESGRRREERGWDGWMALPTQWTWVLVCSGSWWWTGKLDVLLSMGSQRVKHEWATELNWTEIPRRDLVLLWHMRTARLGNFSLFSSSVLSFLYCYLLNKKFHNKTERTERSSLVYSVLCLVAQSCPTVCDPMNCTPPSPWGYSRQ